MLLVPATVAEPDVHVVATYWPVPGVAQPLMTVLAPACDGLPAAHVVAVY